MSFERRFFAFLGVGFALFCAAHQSKAIIDATLQMQLGNPSNATNNPSNHTHYLILRPVEAIDYNDSLGLPNWASWDLTTNDIGSSGRSPNYITDTNLPAGFYQVTSFDYNNSGYDRGHMCPSADRTDTINDNDMVFYMSNIIPQAADNNEQVWKYFEDYCRSQADAGNELLIICGPGGFDGSRIQPSGKVAIPSFTWKVAVVVPLGGGTALSRITTSTRVITIDVPNSNGVSTVWQNFVTSAGKVEQDTGLAFFTALPGTIASALRSRVDGLTNPPAAITSFAPASGGVNTNVVITGTNFTSAYVVAFNGTPAVFTVDSNTQITALLPTNATSGTISVTTPISTATSSSSFTVVNPTNVDFSILCTHTGNFTQGDTGVTYTITVTNVGALESSGTITVTDALPTGLTATAITGTGWTTDLGTLTCTRSDTLSPGGGCPPITIIVNVATNAPATVTNVVTVSGTGDPNLVNNTAGDPTIIYFTTPSSKTTLVGWDVSGQADYGPSPLAPTTNAPNLTIVGLARGSGVGTLGGGAARGWGGTTFTNSTSTAAIASNQFVTFAVAANSGYKVSYSSISRFDYRHSGTGPTDGLLQYQLGSGAFADIATVSYPSSSSSGASINSIDLSGIAALQNVGAGTNVTFRIVNWGGTSSLGTWYIFDVASSSAPDFALEGTVSPAIAPVSDLTLTLTHSGSFTQADPADTYVIPVTTISLGASTGLVTVTDSLPPGLTATAISGTGWTTDLGTLTCTRSDVLVAGSSYPPITITVSVATNAPSSVTNSVTVSGGGQTNAANNTVADPTTINPMTPVQVWRFQWFGTTANSGPAADTSVASSDGMPNLMKYALGLDPLVPTNNPVVVDITTGHLRLTCPKDPDATDVYFHVEVTDAVTGPWTTNGTTVDQNTSTLLQVHDDTALGAAASHFIRLHITNP